MLPDQAVAIGTVIIVAFIRGVRAFCPFVIFTFPMLCFSMVMCLSRRGSSAGKQQCKGSSKKELCHSLMCWFADKDPHWKRRFKKPTAYRTHYAGGRCALLPPQRIGVQNFLSAASGWWYRNHFHLKAPAAFHFAGFQGCRIDLRPLRFRNNNDRLGVGALYWLLLLGDLGSSEKTSPTKQRD